MRYRERHRWDGEARLMRTLCGPLIICMTLLVSTLPSNANAQDGNKRHNRFELQHIVTSVDQTGTSSRWTPQDKTLQWTYTAFHLVDYAQTMNVAYNCDEFIERNPVLGECPSPETVTLYFAGTLGLHWLISNWLEGESRTAWQMGTSLLEFSVTMRNTGTLMVGVRAAID